MNLRLLPLLISTYEIFPLTKFPLVQSCPTMQDTKGIRESNNQSSQKSIFDRLTETVNYYCKRVRFNLTSRHTWFGRLDNPSKGAIIFAHLLVLSKLIRAIIETYTNPANITTHFPIFLGLAYLIKTHVFNA